MQSKPVQIDEIDAMCGANRRYNAAAGNGAALFAQAVTGEFGAASTTPCKVEDVHIYLERFLQACAPTFGHIGGGVHLSPDREYADVEGQWKLLALHYDYDRRGTVQEWFYMMFLPEGQRIHLYLDTPDRRALKDITVDMSSPDRALNGMIKEIVAFCPFWGEIFTTMGECMKHYAGFEPATPKA